MKKLAPLLLVILWACDSKYSDANDSFEDFHAVPMEEIAVPLTKQPPPPPAEEIQRKIIKTGVLIYEVNNSAEEYKEVAQLLTDYEAYFSLENTQKSYDRISYTLEVKVPPYHFDSLILDLSAGKKVESKRVYVNDVTDRYYDLNASIENKKKLETRYQQVLQKATTVKDILAVERNLNEVRLEIESLEGRLKLMKHQIAFSSLELGFYELLPYQYEGESRPGFGKRLLTAFSGGWNGFLDLVVFLIRVWPYVILITALVLLIRKIKKKKAILDE